MKSFLFWILISMLQRKLEFVAGFFLEPSSPLLCSLEWQVGGEPLFLFEVWGCFEAIASTSLKDLRFILDQPVARGSFSDWRSCFVKRYSFASKLLQLLIASRFFRSASVPVFLAWRDRLALGEGQSTFSGLRKLCLEAWPSPGLPGSRRGALNGGSLAGSLAESSLYSRFFEACLWGACSAWSSGALRCGDRSLCSGLLVREIERREALAFLRCDPAVRFSSELELGRARFDFCRSRGLFSSSGTRPWGGCARSCLAGLFGLSREDFCTAERPSRWLR